MKRRFVLGYVITTLLAVPNLAEAEASQCSAAFTNAPNRLSVLIEMSATKNVDTDLAAALAESFRPTLDEAARLLNRQDTSADEIVTTKRLGRHADRLTQFSTALKRFQRLKNENPGLLDRFKIYVRGPKGFQIKNATNEIAEGIEASSLIFREIDREILVSKGLIKSLSRLEEKLKVKIEMLNEAKLTARSTKTALHSPTQLSAKETLERELAQQIGTLEQTIETARALKKNIEKNLVLSESLHQQANNLLTLSLPLISITSQSPELMRQVENTKSIGDTFSKKSEIPRLQQIILDIKDHDLQALAFEQLLSSATDSNRAQIHRWSIKEVLEKPNSHPDLLARFAVYATTAHFDERELRAIEQVASNPSLPTKNRAALKPLFDRKPTPPALALIPAAKSDAHALVDPKSISMKQIESWLPRKRPEWLSRVPFMRTSQLPVRERSFDELKKYWRVSFLEPSQRENMLNLFHAASDGSLAFRDLLDRHLRSESNFSQRAILLATRLLLDEKFGADEKSQAYKTELERLVYEAFTHYASPKETELAFYDVLLRHRILTEDHSVIYSTYYLLESGAFGQTADEIREALLHLPKESRQSVIQFLNEMMADDESFDSLSETVEFDPFYVVPLAFGAATNNSRTLRAAKKINRSLQNIGMNRSSVWPKYLNELLGLELK